MKRKIYNKGQYINDCEFIEEIPLAVNVKRRGFFKCKCGNTFDATFNNVERGLVKSCGCSKKTAGIIHGDSKRSGAHYLYRTWKSIKERCLNPNNKSYYNYGGRGITMFSDWIDDYPNFKEWMLINLGERPDGFSLDRINNDDGYKPNNLRWATSSQQKLNQRK